MTATRALFTSIGAGAALVAAAALSLLTISAVFAFGGWSDSVSQSATKPALVFAGANGDPEAARTVAAANTPSIVAPAPRTRPEPRPAPAASDSNRARAAAPAATSVSAPGSATAPVLDPPVVRRPPNPAPAPTTEKSGDHVRKVGDSLSSTVHNAGDALSQATQPLAPPVSAAVQQVLNVVAEIVRRTTDGVGGTLDTLLPKK